MLAISFVGGVLLFYMINWAFIFKAQSFFLNFVDFLMYMYISSITSENIIMPLKFIQTDTIKDDLESRLMFVYVFAFIISSINLKIVASTLIKTFVF